MELIPLASWLYQKRRCRACAAKISGRYPAVEIVTGIAFYYASVSADGTFLVFLQKALLFSGLIIVFLVDMDHMIIPDVVILPLAVTGMVISAAGTVMPGLEGVPDWKDALVTAGIGFGVFLAIKVGGTLVAGREAMGFGDVKFAAMLGVFLGRDLFLAGMFLAFLIGALVAIPLLLLRGRGMRENVPFGPMMVAGAVVALVGGQQLIDWYGRWMGRLWLY